MVEVHCIHVQKCHNEAIKNYRAGGMAQVA
jgi:hypothetical protein